MAYSGGLLDMAVDIGNRLLKAFDTNTGTQACSFIDLISIGIPFTRINLRRGVTARVSSLNDLCVAHASLGQGQ